jgi:hypothetical protein
MKGPSIYPHYPSEGSPPDMPRYKLCLPEEYDCPCISLVDHLGNFICWFQKGSHYQPGVYKELASRGFDTSWAVWNGNGKFVCKRKSSKEEGEER